jgi:hypothetical protein
MGAATMTAGAVGVSDNTVVWGGALLSLGSLGVVATSVCYAMSPPAAAMPQAMIDLAAAADGAIKGAATMRLAGLFGVTGDIAITAGAFVLATRAVGMSGAGWFVIGLSTIIFAIVDAMVGFVLTPVAAAAGASATFLAVKQLFDALFLLGTATFGAGVVLATAGSALGSDRLLARLLAMLALATGVAALASGAGSLAGVHLERYLGIGILGGSAMFTLIGAHIAFAPNRSLKLLGL